MHERRLDDQEIEEIKHQITEIVVHLKTNKKKIHTLLPWITEVTKKDLRFIEDYYILKYQLLPALRSHLKNPVVYGDTGDSI